MTLIQDITIECTCSASNVYKDVSKMSKSNIRLFFFHSWFQHPLINFEIFLLYCKLLRSSETYLNIVNRMTFFMMVHLRQKNEVRFSKTWSSYRSRAEKREKLQEKKWSFYWDVPPFFWRGGQHIINTSGAILKNGTTFWEWLQRFFFFLNLDNKANSTGECL